ncbi:MAG: phospholipid/cholesterol/gamma-HCH transport system substrate-binding protein [Acidimicrobiaceae bacterium]
MKRALISIVALAVFAWGCSFLPGGGGSRYKLVAYFPRAVSVYASSQVRVLGLPAGDVDSVEVVGDQVKITMSLESSTPVPADVKAQIVPQSLIGERYVQLTPAWIQGQPKAEDGHVIDAKNTIIPVEPDEALAALKKFIDSLDPQGLGRLITNTADDLQGNGPNLNGALDQVSQLVATFAEKDQQLASIVDNFDRFTATLETRESQLGDILSTFAQATQVLADERQGLENLFAGLASLSTNGLQLVSKHSQRLRTDLDIVARLAQSIDANLGTLGQLLDSGPLLIEGLHNAYNPTLRAFNLRTSFGPLVQTVLNPVLTSLVPGFPGIPCLPVPDITCQASTASVGSPVVTSLPAARTPIDDLLGLMATSTVAPRPGRSTADKVADGASSVGGFFRDAAGSLVGVG